MEASQALAGGQGGDNAGQQQGETQQQGPDIGQLAQTLESLQGGQEQLREFLMTQPWAQEEQAGDPEPEAPELDLSFLDPGDPAFDPEAVAQRLGGLIDQVTEQRLQSALQQHIEPLRQEQAEAKREQQARDLVEEFPELKQPEVANEVVAAARQVAEAAGQSELANEPWFWRMTYMAGRAAEAANAEDGDDPAAAHLEGGSGARPGAQQVDPGELIVNAARGGASVLPFG